MNQKKLIKTFLVSIILAVISAGLASCGEVANHGSESGGLHTVPGMENNTSTSQTDIKDMPDIPFKIHPVSSGEASSIWQYMADNDLKVMILDFWALWCDSCKAELVNLEVLYRKYKDSGLGIVGVAVNKDDMNTEGKIGDILKYDKNMEESWVKVGKYPKHDGDTYLSYTIAVDGQGDLTKALGVNTIPKTFLITSDHKVFYQFTGFNEEKIGELEAKVKESLKIQE